MLNKSIFVKGEGIEAMFVKKEAYTSCRIVDSSIPFERIFGQEKSRSSTDLLSASKHKSI